MKEELLAITQADREAAADGCGSVSKAKVIRRGELDRSVLVQAFARHRIASAMSAREGHDPEGHGAKPASAVGNSRDAQPSSPQSSGAHK